MRDRSAAFRIFRFCKYRDSAIPSCNPIYYSNESHKTIQPFDFFVDAKLYMRLAKNDIFGKGEPNLAFKEPKMTWQKAI